MIAEGRQFAQGFELVEVLKIEDCTEVVQLAHRLWLPSSPSRMSPSTWTAPNLSPVDYGAQAAAQLWERPAEGRAAGHCIGRWTDS